MKTSTSGGSARSNRRAVLWITLATIVVTAAGVFHVWNAQQSLAIRRAIWVEIQRSRDLESERTDLRREEAGITAVPRATVKAEVMGLRPPRADQVIRVGENGEALP
jgi:hypothetical protein